jgi:hypothetical protein
VIGHGDRNPPSVSRTTIAGVPEPAAPRAQLHTAIRAGCPATIEDARHDPWITRGLALDLAGRPFYWGDRL